MYYRAVDPETKRLRLFTRKDFAAKLDKDYTSIEVPTDKEGLMEVLQDLIDRGPPVGEPMEEAVTVKTLKIEAKPPEPALPTTSNIEEFLLDHASVRDVERIFACLGTRFGEMTNEKRNGSRPPIPTAKADAEREASPEAQ
jgi:hypothetical protein